MLESQPWFREICVCAVATGLLAGGLEGSTVQVESASTTRSMQGQTAGEATTLEASDAARTVAHLRDRLRAGDEAAVAELFMVDESGEPPMRLIGRLLAAFTEQGVDFVPITVRERDDVAVVVVEDRNDDRDTSDFDPFFLARKDDAWKLLPRLTRVESPQGALTDQQQQALIELRQWFTEWKAEARGERKVPKRDQAAPELIGAALGNNSEKVQRLLESGVDPDLRDEHGRTALMLVLNFVPNSTFDVLLDGGADVKVRSGLSGMTPLHYAVTNRFATPAIIDKLIEHGADVDAVDESGRTPLMMAINHREGAIMERLIAHKASLDVKDASGQTALMVAASIITHPEGMSAKDRRRVVERLLAKGAAIDIADAQGRTALHHAAGAGNVEAVSVLISGGADPLITSTAGQLPREFARGERQEEIVRMLREAEGKRKSQ